MTGKSMEMDRYQQETYKFVAEYDKRLNYGKGSMEE